MNEATTVYTVLTRIIGVSSGKVIFQKLSHFVAPSTFAASNIAGSMERSADRKIRICTPEELTIL